MMSKTKEERVQFFEVTNCDLKKQKAKEVIDILR